MSEVVNIDYLKVYVDQNGTWTKYMHAKRICQKLIYQNTKGIKNSPPFSWGLKGGITT